jgi:hypothetical protein
VEGSGEVSKSTPELCGPLSACHRRMVVGLVCLHKGVVWAWFSGPRVLGDPMSLS